MSWIDGWRHRLNVLRGREQYRREVEQEIRFHLATDVSHRRADGDDAAAGAVRRFGNVTQVQEEVRDMTGYSRWDALRQDVRFALRGMARSLGFTLMVILALGLGIGANTAIFSFMSSVVLRPLPYAQPSALLRVSTQLIGTHEGASLPDFLDWRSRNHTLSSVSAYRPGADTWTPPGEDPARLASARVSTDFLATLGVNPLLGRGFVADDGVFGAHRVVILSEMLWRQRFNADGAVLGKTLLLNGLPHVVIGVAPATLQLPERTQLWMPLAFDPAQQLPGRRSDFLGVVARMKPGVTAEAAQRDLTAVAKQLATEYPATNANVGVLVESLHDVVIGSAGSTLRLLAAAVGLVLLIACANVANLLLARGAARERELSVRVALGAGRGRLLRQLLTESIMLALAGGILGLLVATFGVQVLKGMLPVDFPRLASVLIDWRALLFSGAISLLTGLLFGIAPALALTRDALAQAINDGARSTGVRGQRLRSALVLAQTALALVLLSGAGLMIHSLLLLGRVPLGFEPDGRVAAAVSLPAATYESDEKRLVFFSEFKERMAGIPGAGRAGLTTDLPLATGYNYASITIAGAPPVPASQSGPDIVPTTADSEYFEAMGVRLIAGRIYGNDGVPGGPNVAVVNVETAKRYFNGKSPIGERFTMGSPSDTTNWYTIIGVVASTKLTGIGEETYPQMFRPLSQNPPRRAYFVAHTPGNPLSIIPALRRELRTIDPALPLIDVATLPERLRQSLAPVRLQSLLLSIFSALALCLAALGIYGVVAYSVTQRRREIGIRMALGARGGEVRMLVLRSGMRPVLAGATLGVAGSVAVASLIRSMTFEVGSLDPWSLAAAAVTLTSVAAVACLVPATRAAHVPPTDALRGS